VPPQYLGVDHVDLRVRSLPAVEAFYDGFLPRLGLVTKSYSFVDEQGEWHACEAGHPYNTVEYSEERRPGQPQRFIGIIEDRTMQPTRTRLAFCVATRDDVARWREHLLELGARDIETEADFEAYPAVFFNDPGGTRLEICARRPKLE
jgi:catechol-2,3-dioxygenase